METRADGSTVLPAGSDESGVTYGARLVAAAIVCGMAVGSVALWIGNPTFWFWLTGRLQGTQATMGPYALLIVGILATAVACAKLLAVLNRRYATRWAIRSQRVGLRRLRLRVASAWRGHRRLRPRRLDRQLDSMPETPASRQLRNELDQFRASLEARGKRAAHLIHGELSAGVMKEARRLKKERPSQPIDELVPEARERFADSLPDTSRRSAS